jgi:hypothetical protein
MKQTAILAGVLAALTVANAQRPPDNAIVGSVSGQFFVSARGTSGAMHSLDLAASPGMVNLEPALTAVSCERIKRKLLRELAMRDQWQGKIFVVLLPAQSGDDSVAVAPEWFAGNWNCGIQLPDVVDHERFVETVVRACLLEIANRNARGHSTEVPEWLVRGFAHQLIGSDEEQLILSPPTATENGFSVKRIGVILTDNPRVSGPNIRRLNPLADSIEVMRTNTPLTFDDLSWPGEEQLSGNARKAYGSSAQLFVDQLLRLKNGPASLSMMLAQLPNYLNWQFAFLDAYHNDFDSPLEVEKWWALQSVQFTGRDMLNLLGPEESWKQLDELLHVPIDVTIGPAPAMRTEIKFQTVIHGWSRPRQLEMLRKKLWDLGVLRMRISPDYVPLLDEYQQVLQDYYKDRSSSTRKAPQYGPLLDKLENEVIQKLDALDDKRAVMRSPQETQVVSVSEPTDSTAAKSEAELKSGLQ